MKGEGVIERYTANPNNEVITRILRGYRLENPIINDRNNMSIYENAIKDWTYERRLWEEELKFAHFAKTLAAKYGAYQYQMSLITKDDYIGNHCGMGSISEKVNFEDELLKLILRDIAKDHEVFILDEEATAAYKEFLK